MNLRDLSQRALKRFREKGLKDLLCRILSTGRNEFLLIIARIKNLRYTFAHALMAPVSVPLKDGSVLRFHAQSSQSRSRPRNLFTKEPETNEWISTFAADEVFWDIGSNIGTYSLFAAKTRGVSVIAADPLPSNYFTLVQNAMLNGLTDKIQPFCIAFAEKTEIDKLFVQQPDAGHAGNSFGAAVNYLDQTYEYACTLGTLGISVDDFIRMFKAPFPNHIKIDVDGIEVPILRGAKNTLRDPRLNSVLVEVQEVLETKAADTVDLMTEAGFELSERAVYIDLPHERSCNYIFRRKQ